MKNSRTHNSAKNALLNLIAKLSAMICGFVIRTIFLRYLGDQYTGVTTLFTDILNVLSFTELGIGTAVSFSLYKPIAQNDNFRIAQLMKLYKYVYIAISCVVMAIGVLFVPLLKYFVAEVPDIKESIVLIYLLYVLKTALSYVLVYKSTFVIAKQKQYAVTGIECIATIIKTAIEVVMLAVFKNFVAFLWLEIAFVVVTNLIISGYSKKELIKPPTNIQINKKDFKALFKDVKDIAVYKFCGVVLNSTDSMIVSRFVNISSVTLLSNYNIVFNTINNLIYQLLSAMTASVGNLAVSKTKEEQQQVFYDINFLSFIFAMVECTGLWLCVNPFISILWGERYVLDSSIIVLLCINSYFVNMHLSIEMFRTANGIFHKGRLRPLATAIVNLVVSLIAVQWLGLFGVLLGTVVSRLVTQVWYDPKLVFNTVFKISVKRYYLKYLEYLLLTVACCALGTLLLHTIAANAIITFILGFVFATVFNGLVVIIIFRRTIVFKDILSYLKTLKKEKKGEKQ